MSGDAPTNTPAPQATSQPSQAAQAPGMSNADMLTQSEWTRRLLTVVASVVVGLSVLAIVGVMCYRVAIDGNAPLTNDITSKLMFIAIASLVSMIGALFGSNNVIQKLIEKL